MDRPVRRLGRRAVVASVCLALGPAWSIMGAGTATSQTAPGAANVIAQPANGAAAQVRWTPVGSPAAGWYLQTYDLASGYDGAQWCFACTNLRISNLLPGHSYAWAVFPMGSSSSDGPGAILGSSTASNSIALGPDAVPDPVGGLVAQPSTTDQAITVTWRPATTGQAADFVALYVVSQPKQQWLGPVIVPAFAGRRTLPWFPGQYSIAAQPINSSGKGGLTMSATITILNACSGADVCLNVHPGIKTGTEQLVAQGFVHSLPDAVNASLASELHPALWRLGRLAEVGPVATYKAVETQIVSDHWFSETKAGNGGYAVTPWANWSSFSSFVTNLVQSAEAQGWAPKYWDLFNEPDAVSCATCGYFSVADKASVTTARLLQTFLVEYRAIKAADPAARVVGPSLIGYHDVAREDNMPLDMGTFIGFAGANNMKLDAVSWHENDDQTFSGDWGVSSAAWNVVDHINRARQLVVQHPGVGNPVILINEYGTPQTHSLPAWQVGMFAVAERTGVAGANRSCWTDCWYPGLDGLLAYDGTDWAGTLPAFWAGKAYADMLAGTRVETDSTATLRVDGLSVRQDGASTLRLLLGQHLGCDQPKNPSCPNPVTYPAASTKITIDWPYLSPAANVTVQQIAAGPTAISGPNAISTQRVAINQGKLVVYLPAIADGDAYNVIATASL